ncbi:capsule biosynthesis GfcC family protein [Rheinheimera sp. WS51]|uniref:capsule biosynthesis GfcC family protein n=1 Tax=Rheinheimera sp. WS51 TaxID=3425886 RepID=UPI003D8FADF1
MRLHSVLQIKPKCSLKPLAKWLLTASVLLSSCFMAPIYADEPSELSIQINQQLYRYQFASQLLTDSGVTVQTTAPRLADVLAPVALDDKWYWPVSALYNTSDNSAQLLQQQVLALLAELQEAEASDTDLQQALSAMTKQVQSWQLASRVFITIDYDLARAKAEHNPAFSAGDYLLKLAPRPSHVSVLGLVTQPGKINHKAATPAAGYAADLTYLAAADRHSLYIIQPNGQVVKTTVAAWQQQLVEAMPGAQLFVPFKSGLFSAKWQQLNQAIVQLARHRVL